MSTSSNQASTQNKKITQINHNPEIPKFKLIFLGDQSTGKSCILNRFMNDTFTENYQATVGLDFQSKNVKIDNQDIHLLLYDTAGQEKFRSLIPMYTRDANIILLTYDIAKKESFDNLPKWLNDLTNIDFSKIIFALVGNKIDLERERQVTKEEAEEYAKKNNFIFREVSAKTGEGFSELFYNDIFEQIRTKFRPGSAGIKMEVEEIKYKLDEEKIVDTPKKKCC